MRKMTLLLACLLFAMQAALAQRAITGTVTSAEDGAGIPGVTVLVKGTTIGVTTDLTGKFLISVPANARVLVFSFVGMKTKEVSIDNQTIINVTLESDVFDLEGVVVTALGISREKKSLGYSVQEVKGDDIKQVGQTNLLNSLTGKIAGVQITGATGNTGGSAKILIRGVASVSGSNGPLFIVDGVPIDNSSYNTATANVGAGGYDYGNMAQDLNPEDIESISVLKGAAASALYGSRALNGVILVTTKKGKSQKGFGVTYNTGVTFERIAFNPEHQKTFGGGDVYSGAGTLDGFETAVINGKTYRIVDFKLDESWGPKYNPSIKVLGWNAFDSWDAKNYLIEKPWVYPENNHLSMFNTGATYNNSIAISGGNDMGDLRLSYTNMTVEGYTPNNKMDRNSVNFSGTGKFSKNLEVFTNVNYVRTGANGRPETGYGDHNPVMRMNQWGQNQLDYKELRDYLNPDGTQRTWNRTSWNDPTPVYSDNPYWTYYQNYAIDLRNRVFGNVGFSLTLLDWLKFRTRINMDHYDFTAESRVAKGSQAESGYRLEQRVFTEMNYEGMFLINKNINEDLIFNAILGGNRMDQSFILTGGNTVGGLLLRDWYNLQNSVVPSLAFHNTFEKRINSIFGSATLGYRSMLYLEATWRGDYSSALPKENNFYQYPSLTTSFIFSELGVLKDNPILAFGKLRLNLAKVGGDTDPYRLASVYLANNNFGTSPNYQLPATLNNPDLLPEESTSYEAGLELMFFNNRIGLDLTYYNTVTENQIIPVPTSASTGYTLQIINAGKMENKGVEVLLTGVPLKNKNGLTWNVSLNFAKNNNKVIELAEGVDTYRLASLFGVEIHAEKGQKYGTIRGFNYVLDKNGNRIVGTNGRYLNGPVETLGSYLPDWNAGLINSFSYKGVDLSVQIDMQKGGQMFSLTHAFGTYSGILARTAGLNEKGVELREPAANGGGVLLNGVYGKLVAGNIVYTDAAGNVVTTPITNATRIETTRWAWDHYSRARGAQNVFNTDYIKLREVRIGYTIPAKFTGPVRNVRVSAFGRNLAIWGRADGVDWDPEYVHGSGNVQGIEGGALPSLRTIGLSLNLNF
ncbi:MAG: SusC/RagA family TonB-linked outer membrane protein [Bacteroidales bacterium]|nr:SusC/RagA family TonB-linked outer membrane protein [Bacteroidales bacterium]